MKGILLKIMMVTIILFTNMSHADYIFHSNDPDACKDISGQWSMTGKASNWLIGDCIYQGLANVGILDNSGRFIVDVNASKDSGSFICPNHGATQLSGTCINGFATITTNYGSLSGNFVKNAGDAQGILTVSPGIDADISIKFLRVG